MDKKKQDLLGQTPQSGTFMPTEMGSARFIAQDGEGSCYKYETGAPLYEQGFSGPPWGVVPSMHFVCDEVGIDYHKFIAALSANKMDIEIAEEFGVSEKTVRGLRERFYSIEAINGNYGQD
jgi:hypothetical protein